MKQVIRLAGVVAALAVCAGSASSINSGGAYPGPAIRDTTLGGGEFLVTVSGANKHNARDLAYGRAGKVCGAAGWDLLDGDVTKQERYKVSNAVVYSSVTDDSTYDVTLMYRCRSSSEHVVHDHAPNPTSENTTSRKRGADLPSYR